MGWRSSRVDASVDRHEGRPRGSLWQGAHGSLEMSADAWTEVWNCPVCGLESCTDHTDSPTNDPLTEAGAAERFARRHGEDLRHDKRRNRWLLWRTHRWTPDEDGSLIRIGLDFARTWQRESVEIADRDRREATLKAALRL